MNESAAGIIDIQQRTEAVDARPKDLVSRERRSVTSIIKGVRDIGNWARAGDISTVNPIGEMSRKMESLAELLVLHCRTGSVPERDAIMDRLMKDIDKFKLGRKDPRELPVPDDIEPLLNNVEAIPLAIHDLSGCMARLDIDEQASRKPALDEELQARAAERFKSGWGSLADLATETMESFQEPFSIKTEIPLSNIAEIITRAAVSQNHVTGLPIEVQGFSPDTSIDGSVHWSKFLLRSIVGNAVQNTRRQAQGKPIQPQLKIQLSIGQIEHVEQAGNGSRLLVITLQDNAGGFTEDFLKNEMTGYSNGAESKGVAMKSLKALITSVGGKVDYENVDLAAHNGSGPQIGALTRISLPVTANV